VEQLREQPPPTPVLLNVNVPALPAADIAGVMVTRQGIRRYFDMFEKRIDPRGKTYYWLAGEVVEEGEIPAGFEDGMEIQTDVQANRQRYITITPLQYNLTYFRGMEWVKEVVAAT
jgi:5'-nucleotidase